MTYSWNYSDIIDFFNILLIYMRENIEHILNISILISFIFIYLNINKVLFIYFKEVKDSHYKIKIWNKILKLIFWFFFILLFTFIIYFDYLYPNSFPLNIASLNCKRIIKFILAYLLGSFSFYINKKTYGYKSWRTFLSIFSLITTTLLVCLYLSDTFSLFVINKIQGFICGVIWISQLFFIIQSDKLIYLSSSFSTDLKYINPNIGNNINTNLLTDSTDTESISSHEDGNSGSRRGNINDSESKIKKEEKISSSKTEVKNESNIKIEKSKIKEEKNTNLSKSKIQSENNKSPNISEVVDKWKPSNTLDTPNLRYRRLGYIPKEYEKLLKVHSEPFQNYRNKLGIFEKKEKLSLETRVKSDVILGSSKIQVKKTEDVDIRSWITQVNSGGENSSYSEFETITEKKLSNSKFKEKSEIIKIESKKESKPIRTKVKEKYEWGNLLVKPDSELTIRENKIKNLIQHKYREENIISERSIKNIDNLYLVEDDIANKLRKKTELFELDPKYEKNKKNVEINKNKYEMEKIVDKFKKVLETQEKEKYNNWILSEGYKKGKEVLEKQNEIDNKWDKWITKGNSFNLEDIKLKDNLENINKNYFRSGLFIYSDSDSEIELESDDFIENNSTEFISKSSNINKELFNNSDISNYNSYDSDFDEYNFRNSDIENYDSYSFDSEDDDSESVNFDVKDLNYSEYEFGSDPESDLYNEQFNFKDLMESNKGNLSLDDLNTDEDMDWLFDEDVPIKMISKGIKNNKDYSWTDDQIIIYSDIGKEELNLNSDNKKEWDIESEDFIIENKIKELPNWEIGIIEPKYPKKEDWEDSLECKLLFPNEKEYNEWKSDWMFDRYNPRRWGTFPEITYDNVSKWEKFERYLRWPIIYRPLDWKDDFRTWMLPASELFNIKVNNDKTISRLYWRDWKQGRRGLYSLDLWLKHYSQYFIGPYSFSKYVNYDELLNFEEYFKVYLRFEKELDWIDDREDAMLMDGANDIRIKSKGYRPGYPYKYEIPKPRPLFTWEDLEEVQDFFRVADKDVINSRLFGFDTEIEKWIPIDYDPWLRVGWVGTTGEDYPIWYSRYHPYLNKNIRHFSSFPLNIPTIFRDPIESVNIRQDLYEIIRFWLYRYDDSEIDKLQKWIGSKKHLSNKLNEGIEELIELVKKGEIKHEIISDLLFFIQNGKIEEPIYRPGFWNPQGPVYTSLGEEIPYTESYTKWNDILFTPTDSQYWISRTKERSYLNLSPYRIEDIVFNDISLDWVTFRVLEKIKQKLNDTMLAEQNAIKKVSKMKEKGILDNEKIKEAVGTSMQMNRALNAFNTKLNMEMDLLAYNKNINFSALKDWMNNYNNYVLDPKIYKEIPAGDYVMRLLYDRYSKKYPELRKALIASNFDINKVENRLNELNLNLKDKLLYTFLITNKNEGKINSLDLFFRNEEGDRDFDPGTSAAFYYLEGLIFDELEIKEEDSVINEEKAEKKKYLEDCERVIFVKGREKSEKLLEILNKTLEPKVKEINEKDEKLKSYWGERNTIFNNVEVKKRELQQSQRLGNRVDRFVWEQAMNGFASKSRELEDLIKELDKKLRDLKMNANELFIKKHKETERFNFINTYINKKYPDLSNNPKIKEAHEIKVYTKARNEWLRHQAKILDERDRKLYVVSNRGFKLNKPYEPKLFEERRLADMLFSMTYDKDKWKDYLSQIYNENVFVYKLFDKYEKDDLMYELIRTSINNDVFAFVDSQDDGSNIHKWINYQLDSERRKIYKYWLENEHKFKKRFPWMTWNDYYELFARDNDKEPSHWY